MIGHPIQQCKKLQVQGGTEVVSEVQKGYHKSHFLKNNARHITLSDKVLGITNSIQVNNLQRMWK
jgi:hypothetical protein